MAKIAEGTLINCGKLINCENSGHKCPLRCPRPSQGRPVQGRVRQRQAVHFKQMVSKEYTVRGRGVLEVNHDSTGGVMAMVNYSVDKKYGEQKLR